MAEKRHIAEPIPVPVGAGDFGRADLVFYGVDHSGSSFEARVFINHPAADETTPLNEESGYAGSFFIFGHGGCFGDIGHCDIPQGPRDPFDRRLPHQLTPRKKTVIITDTLRRLCLAGDSNFTVTVVPVESDSPIAGAADLVRFEQISLMTYEG